jgi:hypothetical protein
MINKLVEICKMIQLFKVLNGINNLKMNKEYISYDVVFHTQ